MQTLLLRGEAALERCRKAARQSLVFAIGFVAQRELQQRLSWPFVLLLLLLSSSALLLLLLLCKEPAMIKLFPKAVKTVLSLLLFFFFLF